ncbi:MAG: hypothetical protein WBF51_05010 [Candidatus Dormiibacterota bacterium]
MAEISDIDGVTVEVDAGEVIRVLREAAESGDRVSYSVTPAHGFGHATV